MTRNSLSLLILWWAGSASAGVVQYGATPQESTWTVSGTVYECKMNHKIPKFGDAVFVQKAGRKLALTVHALRYPDRKGTAEVRTIAPDWKKDQSTKVLGKVDYRPKREVISLAPTLSNRLMDELGKGMYPGFHFPNWMDGKDKITIFISAINFQGAYEEFLKCTDGLLQDAFADVRETNIYYDNKQMEPDEEDRSRLDQVVKYAMKDPAVKGVRIEGHTDSVGRIKPNERLSLARADAVAKYLESKGLDKKKIKVQAFGKSQPQVSNSTDEGKAKNRRVYVELIAE